MVELNECINGWNQCMIERMADLTIECMIGMINWMHECVTECNDCVNGCMNWNAMNSTELTNGCTHASMTCTNAWCMREWDACMYECDEGVNEINERMDELMIGRMDECMAWLHDCMNEWPDAWILECNERECMHECMHEWNGWLTAWNWMNACNYWNAWLAEWMHEWMTAWMILGMNEWMIEWMHEWMNECMNEWI